MTERKSLLVIASSSCQLYSGTGRALFDWISIARCSLDVALLVDNGNAENFKIASAFCRDHGVRLYPSEAGWMPGCPDLHPVAAPSVLRSRAWDFVECLSWASAATNLQVLNNLPARSRLLYTPHTQPMSTLQSPDRYFMVPRVLDTMLRRCDLVFVDTPDELAHIDGGILTGETVSFIPLGVDTRRVRLAPGMERIPKRLLSVLDFGEHRKRPDLLMAAFQAVLAADPSFQFIIAGKGSDTYTSVPPSVENWVTRLGYITDEELLHNYRTCSAFVLLSDFEAFGLPFAEALCCGTPVVMTRQSQTEGVFGGMPGVFLVDNKDPTDVRDAVLSIAAGNVDSSTIAAHACARFSMERTYARKLSQVLALPPRPALSSPTHAGKGDVFMQSSGSKLDIRAEETKIFRTTYSIEAEDLMVERIFYGLIGWNSDKPGFYVDIGAFDPIRASNTYLLYKRGWSGVNVEPNPDATPRFASIRPRDITLNVAVGPRGKSGTYVCFDEPLLNGFYDDHQDIIDHHTKNGNRITNKRAIQFVPINDILESNAPNGVDFLNIDIELMEYAVLSEWNFSRWRPKVIAVEIHGPLDIMELSRAPIFRVLADRGYIFISRLWHTSIFTAI